MALAVSLASPILSEIAGIISLAASLMLVAALGAVTYCVALWLLWTASGRPDGLEEIISSSLIDLMRRPSHFAVREIS
jgi:hypothetical protein